ncbi:MAG: dienelactone hydrolase [Actinobacteria bacterium]|nr:dienelactone hydrolase [Actinomycetota bacterium]
MRTTLEVPAGTIPLAFDGPKAAPRTIVIAHGAGAGMDHIFMEHMTKGLTGLGHQVVRFNFRYVEAGKKAPDRQPVLEETYAAVAEHVRSKAKGALVLGGKSMGGRIASNIAASGTAADGLVFFGYPLHPPGRPERIRDAHLKEITCPMLFIEGTRDPFCPLDTLKKVLRKVPASTSTHVIEGGDHSFKVPKSSGRSTDEAWDEVVDAASGFLSELGAG